MPQGFSATMMGAGYDVETSEQRGHCVEGTQELDASTEAAFEFPLGQLSRSDLVRLFGIESDSDVIGLDQDEAVRDFVDSLAVEDPTALSVLSSTRYRQGFIEFTNDRHKVEDDACPANFVYSMVLGAQFTYGLRFQLKDESVADELSARFGATDILSLLQQPEAAEEVLTGKATVEAFVLQVGGGKTSAEQVLRDARCSASELEGCRELLIALNATFDEFNAGLSDPSFDDLAGWVPTQLRLGDYR